jgi:hypothetical protein
MTTQAQVWYWCFGARWFTCRTISSGFERRRNGAAREMRQINCGLIGASQTAEPAWDLSF